MRFPLFISAFTGILLCQPLAAGIRISEFLAANVNGMEDENGDNSDWIELYNDGTTAQNLDGWWLTDNLAQPAKWRIPAVTLQPGGYLLVWASSKNRANPALPLHTNFALAQNGEYLGLYRPHATTGQPELVDEYKDTGSGYPPQVNDISYGRNITAVPSTVIATGATARFTVLPNNSTGQTAYSGTSYASGHVGTDQGGGWNMSPAFNDSAWTLGQTGIGYDTSGGLLDLVGTSPSGNCQTALRNVNTSLLFRQTFNVTGASTLVSAKLRIRYEDGFVAWINGVEVARENFSGTPAYNSRSIAALEEAIVESWTEFNFSPSLLNNGANVLAIQGLNSSLGSSDFLLLPEIQLAAPPPGGGLAVYMNPPTPGQANVEGSAGPLLYDATPADPNIPRPLGTAASPPMVVTVKAIKTRNNITQVRVIPRVMFNAEGAAIAMNDSGVAPDAVANDGTWSASISTLSVSSGQMLRWRFEAVDTAAVVTKLPSYADPLDSPQYFGTVALTPWANTSQLPIMDWFVQSANTSGPTTNSFRASFYYLGNFYDNTYHELRGQSTRGFPKKSYNFDSNDNHRFFWKEGERRVKDMKLMTNYADKTKARNTISHEIGKMAGTVYHFAHPIRVHLNGSFHGVMDLMEDGDDRLLERNGLDPEGAFYKIYAENLTSSAEKKTRKLEPNTDLAALASGLNASFDINTRRTYAYDNLNIPATINYLVVRQFNSDRDHGHKNFYLYRDTNGSQEWQPVVWDVDLSQGHNWNGSEGYFDDDLVSNNPLNAGASNNAVYNLIYESPEMREMFTRRLRTLMDTILGPQGTTNGIMETRLREIAASVDPDPAVSTWTDGDLDAQKWGIDSRFLPNRPREEVERVITGYLAPRRTFLFNTASNRPVLVKPGLTADATNSTPIPNNAQTNTQNLVLVDSVQANPNAVSSALNQSHEFIILRNPGSQAVDISGWKLAGAVDHVFAGGTVIPAGAGTPAVDYRGLLHVARDAKAFRQRTVAPTGGQRRLVQGGYSGQLSARGETVELRDNNNVLIHSLTYTGSPTPAQQFLRVSEIQYHPAEPSAAESLARPGVTDNDFEYLELVNTGTSPVVLTGAGFTAGLSFTFPAHSMPGGSRIILAKDPAAFSMRYPAVSATVFGPYDGQLDNAGERLEITDPSGEVVLDFEYKDGWYPATDGSGRSLVLRDAATAPDAFASPTSWGISLDANGSPGTVGGGFAQAYHGWDNFHFTALERDNPAIAGPEADPDGDGRANWQEYALGRDPRVADAPGIGFSRVDFSGNNHAALNFRRPRNALDLTYQLVAAATPSPAGMAEVPATVTGNSPVAPNHEDVVLRENAPAHPSRRFFSLRLTFTP